jgi:serine/threonine-protein kinase
MGLESGRIIAAKYRLNRPIGSGGMAEVWSATNVTTDKEFAIKFLNADVMKSKEAAARFLKEGKVSARINHPNVIDVLDMGQTEDGRLFMVMELLTGVTLEVALRRQTPPMTLSEFAFVMVEVARALAAAHRAGVVHRDLKPTNIFLHKDKAGAAVKLLDFGVSKFLEEDRDAGLTVAGTVLGSPLYMSPEQARGDVAIDHRSDIFSYGAIMFEALTGFRPFDAPNFNALIVNIATKIPKDVDVCAQQMPESLRNIVKLCLETNRDRRAPNLDAIGEMLFAILPELEKSPIRLPSAMTQLSNHDPDATNALPVVTASDRPPPPAVAAAMVRAPTPGAQRISSPPMSGPMSGPMSARPGQPISAPPPAYSHPWQTPRFATTTFSRKRQQTIAWVVSIAAGAFVMLVLLGVTVALRLRHTEPKVATTQKRPAESTTVLGAIATAAPPPTSDLPTMDVDALPTDHLGPVPKGMGRIFVGSQPGWCAISVDGNKKGPTPLPALDLAVGPHQIRCEPPNGKPTKVAGVTVLEGQTARYAFKLDE